MKTKITKEQDVDIAKKYIGGSTAQKIADEYHVYKQSILNSLKRSGVERRKDWKRASGKKNGHWNGGIRMIGGYRYVFRPGHRLSRGDGWVSEHRLIMENEIIELCQVVHHIDGNKLNNSRENLFVYSNNGVHRKLHVKKEHRNSLGKFCC